jgi:hypothetical protein
MIEQRVDWWRSMGSSIKVFVKCIFDVSTCPSFGGAFSMNLGGVYYTKVVRIGDFPTRS